MTDLATRAGAAEGDDTPGGVKTDVDTTFDDGADEAFIDDTDDTVTDDTVVVDGTDGAVTDVIDDTATDDTATDDAIVVDGTDGAVTDVIDDTATDDTVVVGGTDEPPVEWAPAEPRPKKRHLALWIGIPLAVVLVGVGITSTILIAPGVAIAGVPVGGMTPGAAADAVQTTLAETTVVLTGADGSEIALTGAELGAVVDAKALANGAYGEYPLWKVGAWNPEPIPAPVVLEPDEAAAVLQEAAPALYVDPVDAGVAFDPAVGAYVVVPAVLGSGLDVAAVESALSEALAAGDGTITIDAPSRPVEATITTAEAEAGAAQVNAMVAQSGFYIGEERTVPVDAATTASWLTVALDETGAPTITADPAALRPLIETLPAAVNRNPVNAATIVNSSGAVLRTSTAGVSGRSLPTTEGLAEQYAAQLGQGNAVMALPVAEVPYQTVSIARLLEVDLSEQRLYLKENGNVVDSWAISSGAGGTPTYEGRYRINSHLTSQTMRGQNLDGTPYVTPNVKWVMYFNGDQAFHGVYWHSNWGRRMSHGCVGMPESRAQQIYNWSPNGVDVWIHG